MTTIIKAQKRPDKYRVAAKERKAAEQAQVIPVGVPETVPEPVKPKAKAKTPKKTKKATAKP